MGAIDIEAVTKVVEPDNNLPLKTYLRSARNILKEAEIYRNEGNKLQLYIFLLRYVSLVLKTIPRHKDSSNAVFARECQYLKQQVFPAFNELEALKPQVELLNRLGNLHLDDDDSFPQEEDGIVPSYFPSSPPRPPSQTISANSSTSLYAPLYQPSSNQGYTGDALEAWARTIGAPSAEQQQSYSMVVSTPAPPAYGSSSYSSSFSLPVALSGLTLSTDLPTPSAEALSRHSFFSISSSSASSQSHLSTNGPLQVSYPSFDPSPVAVPDLLQSWKAPTVKPSEVTTAATDSAAAPSGVAGIAVASPVPETQQQPGQPNTGDKEMISVLLPSTHALAPAPVPSPASEQAKILTDRAAAEVAAAAAAAANASPQVQPIPPPVRAEVVTIPRDASSQHNHHPQTQPQPQPQPHPSKIADPRPGKPSSKVGSGTKIKLGGVKAVHINTNLMDEFMRMVQSNTKRNLETCGVLAGHLEKGTFFITTLILPKQQATSDSCSTLNEEEIFEVQDKRGLFQMGWIHTHPSQACFMSSIDLHTHYSYQVMLPEAIAIVMAPTDSSRRSGIFRLSDPGGMKVIQNCHLRGFHPHEAPVDGSPLYVHAPHVFYNPKVKFEVVDIRST